MSTANILMPALELRQTVGPTDPEDFDNPSGEPIYAEFGLPLEAYDSVFDFGCGCGRLARQLLQQAPRPFRYVGVDPHKKMIDWCRENLSSVDRNFQFFHHDVYSTGYAPENSLRLAEPFPVDDGAISLVIAHSVFTHLCRQQTEYYLHEIARVLKPQGIAFTSWLFFDRASFPFLGEGPFCLYTSEADFSQAVLYDRTWFLETVRRLGLGVQSTHRPEVPGHQWSVFLVKCAPDMIDQFPLGEEEADWICGATMKPMATAAGAEEILERIKGYPAEKRKRATLNNPSSRPQPPTLFGALAVLSEMKQSWAWRIGRAMTAPVRVLKRFLRR